MLANVLPGVRDFRTPLVIGILYLTVLWLWFGDALIPDANAPTVLERRLAELYADYGPTLGLTVLSFVAYLVGTLLTINSLPIERLRPIERLLPFLSLGNLQATSQQWATRTAQLMPAVVLIPATELSPRLASRVVHQDIREHDELRRNEPRSPGRVLIERQVFVEICVLSLVEDRSSLEMRLAQGAEARFNDYDRQQSEAALRFSMVVPLALLAITFTLDFPIAASALVVPLVLAIQGINLLGRARLMIVTALINEIIHSPTRDAVYRQPENGRASPS